MIKYYTAVVVLSCLALCVLGIQVFQNARFSKSTKRRFYLTYAVVILATFAEWAGVTLNGAPSWTVEIHAVVKCIDYIFTPVAGVCVALQISELKEWKKHRPVFVILLANALFEIVSLFTGWTFYVDAENYYHHGSLYFIYAVVYCIAIADVLFSFRAYSKHFKRNNRISLYAIVFLACFGIAMQEFDGDTIRTSCLSLAFGSILLFIHYNEFLQLQSDDSLSVQRTMIETDALTGLFSRYSYIQALNEYNQADTLPRTLTVFSFDINGLKIVNDTKGHKAGDELICGAAACISSAVGTNGKCFRIGGDEFVAILDINRDQVPVILQSLTAAQNAWHGKTVNSLSISSGYVIAEDHPELSVEKMVNLADQMMYTNKELHYRQNAQYPYRAADHSPQAPENHTSA